MIVIDSYRDQRIAVYGLGRSGLSTAEALIAGGAQVLAWDDDPDRREAARSVGAMPVEPGRQSWRGIRALVLSPGIPLTHPAPHIVALLADSLGAEILGDVELFARTRPLAPIVAITGTNGKSTTTALIAHLLRQSGRAIEAGANLGMPVLGFEPLPASGAYVLELSSYQIDLTRSLRPQVVALVNISPDHLDRHGGMDGYVAAKRRLLAMAPPSATLVVGIDDSWSREIAVEMRRQGRRVVEVAVGKRLSEGVFVQDGLIYRAAGSTRVRMADLNGIASLRGTHNWQNAAIAFAVAEALGTSSRVVEAALRSFPGLAHRMEVVGHRDGVTFVNDSKATNADAASHALAAYERIYWIAGGIAKEGGIASLAPLFPRIRRAFLIGEAAGDFAATLDGDLAHEQSGDLSTALAAAYEAARREGGGTVLLSPACASFDQFASFEARGDSFRELVEALPQDATAPRTAGAFA